MNSVEFRCRGKRLNGGQWVDGYYTHLDYSDCHFIADDNGNCYPVDPNTVGRYVGIKDIKGRNVCEHDIVRLTKDVACIFSLPEYGIVNYHYGSFYIGSRHELRSTANCITDINYILRGEVIGNIFDNPDLLEEAYCAGKHETN